MKQIFKTTIFLLLALLLPATASAFRFEVDGIYYYTDGEYVTVTDADGNTNTHDYTGDVIIPETVTYAGTTYSVTTIDAYAFYYCNGLTSVTIPNTVTYIGECAFYNCRSLTTLTIGNSVSYIEYEAFSDCYGITDLIWNAKNCSYNGDMATSNIERVTIGDEVEVLPNYFVRESKISTVIIPNSVTTIGSSAFSNCDNLIVVTMGNSVSSISNNAFYSCDGLTSIELPECVTTIGNYAFSDCISLTSIDIPNSVTTIGNSAFRNCGRLTNVTIGDSVSSISNYAFGNCTVLTSLTIGKAVSSISSNAFSDCYGITDLIWNAKNCSYNGDMATSNIERVTIGDEVEVLPDNFVSGSKITSLTIPNSVTTIGSSAFSNCDNLIVVTMGNSVSSISNYAFYSCDGLTSIELPECVTTIDYYAFSDCISLTSIDIPNSVTTIGDCVFRNCGSLTNVTIGDSVSSIGSNAFQNCSALTNVIIGKAVSSVGYNAFYGCSGITDLIWNAKNCSYNGDMATSNIERVTIGNEVEVLPSYFVRNSKITSVIIPDSVTTIGSYAFQNCSGLTDVIIGNSVSSMGYYAFYGSSGITDLVWNARNCSSNGDMATSNIERVTIGNEVEVLPSYFVSNSKITSVIIPDSVTTIGNYAFSNCINLVSIDLPDSVTTIGERAFSNCRSLTDIDIPNSVTSICSYTFYNCRSLTSATIPNSVASIGSSAFSGCSNLVSIDFPNSVTTIGESAFQYCRGLTNVTIGKAVSFIGSYAFSECSNLTSVVLPNSLNFIEEGLFAGCSSLADLSIPNSVTSIGSSAFQYCEGLTSITIPNSVTTIGSNAFYYCSNLTSLTIGKSVTSIGYDAFRYCYSLRNIAFNAVNCTSIGGTAFWYSSGCLLSLQFGDSVEHIPAGLPSFDMSGKTLVLPNSVKTIDFGAIYGYCDAVVIGKGVENIAAETFSEGISVAYVSTTDPQPCEPGAFYNPQILYVPAGCKNKYFTASGWSEFPYIIEGEYAVADSIVLDNTELSIYRDATAQLSATILPEMASATTTGWYSINENIATVDDNGFVTANAVGETDIVAWVDNVATSCHVIVTPVMVENIILSDNHLSMAISDMYTLSVTAVTPDNAEVKELEWEIPENDVITTQLVNNSRLNISAENEGRVTITVRATDGSGRIATCEVFVSSTTPVKTLTITPETLDLHVGYSQQLTATITPEDAYTKTLQWMTSNSNVAYVNSNGVVTAYGVGTATITAITTDGSNLSATCAVSVTTVPVESVTLNRTELEMNEGSSYTLSATVLPNDAYNRSLTWTSSNPRVATVNSNGRVTAVGIGSTIVTATTNDGTNITATCHVTVKSQMANDCFVIPDTEVLYGESVVIPVRLNNVRSFMAFQTDIFLPEGFKVAKNDNGKYIVTPSSRMTSDHVIMTQDVSNGAVRVICYTPIGSAFTGGSGTDLFYITVTVPDDAGGDYSINLRNSRLTTANYTEVTIPDAGAVIKVKTFIPGDVNNSHTVTVTDIVVTAQYILEMNPDPFVFEAADMNGDGNITVTDIMLIVQKIMNPSMHNAPRRMPALMNVDDRMSGEDVSLMAGETRTVTIALDNTLDYSAFQLDLTLPEGLTATNFTLTDRAGSHLLNVNTLSDGAIRALCYSPTIEMIDGHSGALLTFDLSATDAVEGLITVDGIELVTTDCQTVLLDGFAIGVHGATGVNELNSSKEVARVDYFNLAGQRIDRPDSGVTIVVTTYTDGTRSTTKLFQ